MLYRISVQQPLSRHHLIISDRLGAIHPQLSLEPTLCAEMPLAHKVPV